MTETSEQQWQLNKYKVLATYYSAETRNDEYNQRLMINYLKFYFPINGVSLYFNHFLEGKGDANKVQTQYEKNKKTKAKPSHDWAIKLAKNDLVETDDGERMRYFIANFPEREYTGDNDQECSMLVYERLTDIFPGEKAKYSNGKVYIKMTNEYIWKEDDKDHSLLSESVFRSPIMMNKINFLTGAHDIVKWTNSGSLREKTRNVLNLLIKNEDKKFNAKLHNDTIGKICYKNGVYDIPTGKFCLYDNLPVLGYFFNSCMKINRDYNMEGPDRELMNEIRRDIFENTLGEYTDQFLHMMCRGISGHKDKVWGNWSAPRNAGRSLIAAFIKNTFEDYVMTSQSADNVAKKYKINDPASDKKWLGILEFVRISFMSEVQSNILDGNLLKMLSSGEDKIDWRGLYQDIRSLQFETLFFLINNIRPEIEPLNALQTLLNFETPNFYMTDQNRSNYLSKFERDNDTLHIPIIRDKPFTKSEFEQCCKKYTIHKIQEKIKTIEYIEALEALIYEHYTASPCESNYDLFNNTCEPPSNKKFKESMDESKNNEEDLEKFFKEYFVTSTTLSQIYIKDIQKLIEERNVKSPKKFMDEFIAKFELKKKKEKAKDGIPSKTYLIGIRFKNS